jgi:hypothetical protein
MRASIQYMARGVEPSLPYHRRLGVNEADSVERDVVPTHIEAE